MTMLILGVLLWSVVHFIPVFAPTMRAGLIDQMGAKRYRGIFALTMVGALLLIIFGWRSAEVEADIYASYGLRHVTYGLVLLSILLFGAAKSQSRIRQFIRHPMLMGVVLWSTGHLLVNNDPRSLILFGGMLLWALLSIVGINRREGAYVRPEIWSWAREIRLVVISAVIYVVLVFGHPYFAGIALF